MDRATKQYLNDAPWPKPKRRPRLWPLATIYLIGVVVICTGMVIFQNLALLFIGAGIGWHVFWIWGMAAVLKAQKAWDAQHQGYDYSRWRW